MTYHVRGLPKLDPPNLEFVQHQESKPTGFRSNYNRHAIRVLSFLNHAISLVLAGRRSIPVLNGESCLHLFQRGPL